MPIGIIRLEADLVAQERNLLGEMGLGLYQVPLSFQRPCEQSMDLRVLGPSPDGIPIEGDLFVGLALESQEPAEIRDDLGVLGMRLDPFAKSIDDFLGPC